jgi:hypothetical protein
MIPPSIYGSLHLFCYLFIYAFIRSFSFFLSFSLSFFHSFLFYSIDIKGTNCNPPVPCPCNGYPPLKECSARRRNVFCGLGPHRISCPKGFSCDVHPTDRFAVCCDESESTQWILSLITKKARVFSCFPKTWNNRFHSQVVNKNKVRRQIQVYEGSLRVTFNKQSVL